MFGEDQLKWYDKVNRGRPTHISHGISQDNIDQHMRRLKPHTWRLEGNQLIGMTEMGELRQVIPPEYILVGTTDDGLPHLEKVVLQENQ